MLGEGKGEPGVDLVNGSFGLGSGRISFGSGEIRVCDVSNTFEYNCTNHHLSHYVDGSGWVGSGWFGFG